MKKYLALLVFLAALVGVPAYATTYYISSSTGSNTNNGTSKATAWKSHPYMPAVSGCSGSGSAPAYTHAAGDQFIFMGGDTWGVACWYINPQAGGSSSGTRDYYGVDKTWWNSGVCGGSWCRPIMDEQSQVPVGGAFGGPTNRPQWFCPNCGTGGPQHIVVDNFEIVNVFWDGSVSTGTNQIALIGGDASDCDYVIENLYLHKWTHGTGFPGDILELFTDRAATCGGDPTQTGQMLNNVMDNSDGSCDSGQFGAAYIIDGNFINCVPNIVVGENTQFSNNIIPFMPNSYDDAATPGCVRCIHENGYEGWLATNASQYIYNNTWHDTASHGITVFLTPSFGVNGGPTTGYFFNNVIWNSNNANPVYIDSDCGNGVSCDISQMSMYLWNNTLNGTINNTQCIRLIARSQPTIMLVDLRNNQCITGAGTGTAGLFTNDMGITPTTLVTTDNLTMTGATATSDGYVITNSFRPTSSGSPTVGVGSNLTTNCSGSLTSLCSDANGVWNATGTGYGTGMNNTRPGSGAWDVGAYEQGGGAATCVVSLSTSSLSYGNQTTGTSSAAQTITFTNNGAATCTGTITLATGTQYSISGGTCSTGSLSVTASGSCTALVTFSPLTNGAKSDTLAFNTNADSSPDNVSLSGTGVAPSASSSTVGSGIVRGPGIIR